MSSAACASGGSERDARRRREPEAAARRSGAGRPADPDPVRQAGPAAVHLTPGLRPRLRAGDAPRRGTDRVLPGLHPAPQDLVRQRRPHRVSPARRSTWRSGCRPRSTRAAGARRWTRRCRPGWTCWRRSRPTAAAWPSGSTPPAGGSSCPGSTRPTLRHAVASFTEAAEVPVERLTKQGRRTFDARGRGGTDRGTGATFRGQRRTVCDTRPSRTAGHPVRTTR